MVHDLSKILDGLYTMVNASDTVQMSQQFAEDGKGSGTIFVSRIGTDKGFRFSFSTAEVVGGDKTVIYAMFRGKDLHHSYIIPRTLFTANSEEGDEAVDKALLQLTELIENLDNGVAL